MFIDDISIELPSPSMWEPSGRVRVKLTITCTAAEAAELWQRFGREPQTVRSRTVNHWRDITEPGVAHATAQLPGGPKQLTAGPEVLEGVIIDDE